MTERGILFLLIFSWCLLLVLPGESLMPTLNRFPLLGLWAEEAARRLGYTKGEAEALGHAYAIRARGTPKKAAEHGKERPAGRKKPAAEEVEFGGDRLAVAHAAGGRLRGRVGGEAEQT